MCIILKTVNCVTVPELCGLNLPDTVHEPIGIYIRKLISMMSAGSAGLEKLIEIQLAAAQVFQDFRSQIQESALVVFHLPGAGKPMHAEGRKNIHLIGFEQIQFVIDAHILPAMKMNIELIIIVAVVLGYFHLLIETVMSFIPLASLSHWLKRGLDFIGFHKTSVQNLHIMKEGNVYDQRGYRRNRRNLSRTYPGISEISGALPYRGACGYYP